MVLECVGSFASDLRVDWLSLCMVTCELLGTVLLVVRCSRCCRAASMAWVSAWKTVACLPRKPFPSARSSGPDFSLVVYIQYPNPVLLLMWEPSVKISIGDCVVHS